MSQVAVFSNESMVQNALFGVHARFHRSSFLCTTGFELLNNCSGCGSPRAGSSGDNSSTFNGQCFEGRLNANGANAVS